MADDFTIDEGEGFPASSGDEFDPSEMSLDEIDSLLSNDEGGGDFSFDALPVNEQDSGDFQDLLASSGEEYPDDFGNFEPEETDFTSDLSQLDESVHLDEDFDFDLTDPLIDAEIDRLLDIEDDGSDPIAPSSSGAAPSWKETSSTPESHEDGFGDLGALDLGDFSQPGEVPASAFHSDDQPFDWAGDLDSGISEDDHEESVGFSEVDLEDEGPLSLSDDELHNIDISADLADFSMDDEEEETPSSEPSSKIQEDDFLSDDEGPITLSEHELGDITGSDADFGHQDEGFGDLGNDDFSVPSSELTSDSDFEGEEDKDIALSIDELDHLLMGDDSSGTEEVKDSFEELGEFGDLDLGPVDESGEISNDEFTTDEADADEPIALSDDELGNLLSSGEEEEVVEPIDLDSLDLGEDSRFESDADFGSPTESSENELDLSDFNFDTDQDSGKDFGATGEEDEESISLPVSDFDDFGSEESNPLDSGMDLGDFESASSSSEEDLLESIGDFTLASDDDVLGSSSTEEDFLAPPGDLGTPQDEFLADGEDEPIALSDDELGNLLSSGEEEEEVGDLGAGLATESPDFLSDADADEPIALSDDELGNLLASDEETPDEFATDSEEEDQGPIALSDDELGDLLSSGTDDGDDFFADAPDQEEESHGPLEFGDFSLDSESDEPIALSEEELGHLLEEGEEEPEAGTGLLDDSDEPISLPVGELDEVASGIDPNQYDVDWDGPVADLNELGEQQEAAPSDWDLDSEPDEPITLSDDELGNLLSDEAPQEVDTEDLNSLLSSPPEATDLDALGSINGDIPIVDLDFTGNIGGEIVPTVERLPAEPELNFILDEYAEEGEKSPLEEVRQAGADDLSQESGEESTPTQDEMKRILLYLDELLGNLPDDMIRDFSRSDYFELYKKLMKQIGV